MSNGIVILRERLSWFRQDNFVSLARRRLWGERKLLPLQHCRRHLGGKKRRCAKKLFGKLPKRTPKAFGVFLRISPSLDWNRSGFRLRTLYRCTCHGRGHLWDRCKNRGCSAQWQSARRCDKCRCCSKSRRSRRDPPSVAQGEPRPFCDWLQALTIVGGFVAVTL